MAGTEQRKQQAKWLRIFRTWHRSTGALLFAFFFIVSVTGLLLGWKKHSGDLLLAASRSGTSSDLKDWLPLDSLHTLACAVFRDSISADAPLELDRIDVRKDKGMVKFIFISGFWGIQLDGATGAVLHIERRRSDFIEKIHDGSLLDLWLGTGNGQIKLFYTTLMGLALLLFTVTGFWLWYGPVRMRRAKRGR
jgi:hypothetical protein